jgi:hypothetical protein
MIDATMKRQRCFIGPTISARSRAASRGERLRRRRMRVSLVILGRANETNG